MMMKTLQNQASIILLKALIIKKLLTTFPSILEEIMRYELWETFEPSAFKTKLLENCETDV